MILRRHLRGGGEEGSPLTIKEFLNESGGEGRTRERVQQLVEGGW